MQILHPPLYNSNRTKERSSAEVCTRDWVQSTQSQTPEGAFQSERGEKSKEIDTSLYGNHLY